MPLSPKATTRARRWSRDCSRNWATLCRVIDKRLEGIQHADRNAQFEHLDETVRRQLASNEPVISVDTKKKELVGPYKNTGRELRSTGDPQEVNVHHFVDPEQGRAAPYGVYDL